jgi:aldose sugar dehydrogenase
MTKRPFSLAAISFTALMAASCGVQATGETPEARSTRAPAATGAPFAVTPHGNFNEPWAAAFVPGTAMLVITEKSGSVKFVDTRTGRQGTVTGAPTVDYGGQGGLGDVAFLPGESSATLDRRTIFLSWAEAGPDDTRGAAVGRGTLVCAQADACRIEGLSVIWRQPKVSGRGHYSHRIAISPDGRHLFVASGDRQKMSPAQDTANNLGSIVRLNLDGTPASGNPFAGQAGKAQDIWSYGHRNTLGLAFDAQGSLWNVEHGPAGGDEINLVRKGANYGWPVVSQGEHYDGKDIPPHSARAEIAVPAISWTPVIAPGDFLIYSGKLWPEWKGQAIVAAMKPGSLVRVALDGDTASEVARHPMDKRIREVVEGPDGALWLLEDKAGGRLLELRPGG